MACDRGTMHLVPIASEFAGADVGDARLSKRISSVVVALERQPDASYPAIFSQEDDREGFYRLVRNRSVTHNAVLAPHVDATVLRAQEVDCTLVIHDSTEIVHGAGSAGTDFYELQSKRHFGYVAHVGLCVSLADRAPLGIVHLECVERAAAAVRAGNRERSRKEAWLDPNKESLRWVRGVEVTGALLPDAIHVADREGDSYEFLALCSPYSFVIRGGAYDRRVMDLQGEPGLLMEVADRESLLLCRKSHLSARSNQGKDAKAHPSRPARTAKLGISAARLSLVRPVSNAAVNATGAKIPATLPINVVVVREIDPPEGESPVEWILYTNESIDTPEQVARVVDIYRTRWLIEECFKALKTGCAFSRRQFESRKTSQTALALTLPIAVRLLALRALDRQNPKSSVRTILGEEEVTALSILTGTSKNKLKTVGQAMTAVARVGGHITSNGAPGWQVLGRGWLKMVEFVEISRLVLRSQQGDPPRQRPKRARLGASGERS